MEALYSQRHCPDQTLSTPPDPARGMLALPSWGTVRTAGNRVRLAAGAGAAPVPFVVDVAVVAAGVFVFVVGAGVGRSPTFRLNDSVLWGEARPYWNVEISSWWW